MSFQVIVLTSALSHLTEVCLLTILLLLTSPTPVLALGQVVVVSLESH